MRAVVQEGDGGGGGGSTVLGSRESGGGDGSGIGGEASGSMCAGGRRGGLVEARRLRQATVGIGVHGLLGLGPPRPEVVQLQGQPLLRQRSQLLPLQQQLLQTLPPAETWCRGLPVCVIV